MTVCRICKKKVTNRLSVKRQLGRVCFKKWKAGYRGIQIEPFENIRKVKELVK